MTWLTDSSGLVFIDYHNARLIAYDLESKKMRVLVDKGIRTCWPAVSPDGHSIAVANRTRHPGGRVSLEVVIYDRRGKEQRRSKALNGFADGGLVDSYATHPVLVFWSPDGGKLLLAAEGKSGLYDLQSQALKVFPGNLHVVGGSPVRPDGKGFLAGADFVDWQGRARHLNLPDVLNGAPGTMENYRALRHLWMIELPMLYSSRWDGNDAVVTWSTDRVRLDTVKGTVRKEKVKPARTDDGKFIQHQHKFGADGAVVRLVELKERDDPLQNSGDVDALGAYCLEREYSPQF